jgi:WD40 repeat protein
MFVSGSDDNTLKVWDLATATAVTFSGAQLVQGLPQQHQ